MSKHSLSIGLMALVAAALLPAQADAGHENRYFGFYTGPQPFSYAYPYGYGYYPPPAYARPPVYAPPPRVRQTRPGVYEYEVSPGRWVRVRPGYGYQPPLQQREQRQQRVRVRPQGPPPVPKRKPESIDSSQVAIQSIPEIASPSERSQRAAAPEPVERAAAPEPVERAAAPEPVGRISCDAAADIIRKFGFSDVQPTSCSGQVYDFSAARDGSAYSIKLSAADGELTEVRKH